MKLTDILNSSFIKKDEITEKRQITNTRIGDKNAKIPGGSYHIPDENYDNFLKAHFAETIEKGGKEYLTEAQLPSGGPIAIDIDLRFDYAVNTRLFTKEHISDLLCLYLAELQKIYQFDETTRFPVYVFLKSGVNQLEEKQITKDGIHMIIGLQADRAVQVHLRKQMIKEIDGVWTDLPITNSWEDVFDEGISIGHTNWQLIGSRKPNHDAYQLVYGYNISVDPADQEVMMPEIDVKKFMTSANVPQLSVRYKHHPLLFMKSGFIEIYDQLKGTVGSSRRTKPPTNQIISYGGGSGGGNNGDILQILFSVRNMTDLDTAVSRFIDSLETSELDLRESYEYTMTLPDSYWGAGSFSKWIRVGWALRNISDKLFVIWVKFSAQAPNFDFTSIRDDLYERWVKFDLKNPNGLTKRSIMHWAKKDNINEYNAVRHQSVDYYIDQTIKSISIDTVANDRTVRGCGDYDIAKVLYQLFKDEYVCASVKGGIWYRYKNHRWAEIDSGTTLRKSISEEIRSLYICKIIELQAKVANIPATEENAKVNQAIIAKIGEISARLGRTNDKKNIMTEARELFYDGTFMKKLDVNPYLLGFNNGVVDFKEKCFRSGYPEDNVSRCTNIDYIEHDPIKHSVIIAEINDFFDKLFPNKERRRYFWDHLASTLIGTSANQTFNMYIGMGQNGKSVLVSLMEKVLGEYKGDVPLTLITQQRTKIGGLAPELVQLRGVRYAVIQEPSKGDRINEGIMKQITSGVDPIQARAPYMPEIISFIPQFKLVVCSNTLMTISSNDHGTWRRIRVVDFESLFTENPDTMDRSKPHQFLLDRHIIEKFETWAPILASMLVHRVYETNGVVEDCADVLASSNSYRASQDYIAEFIIDRVAKHPNECIQKTMLANVFKEWYSTNYGTRIPNIKDIMEHMDKQFGKNRNGTWSGVKIIFDSENSGSNNGASAASNAGAGAGAGADEDDFDIDDIDLIEV